MGTNRPAGGRRDARTRRAPMSEYQYYEFLAVDRPLTEPEMRELRAVSSRAVITPTRFTNHYEWCRLQKGNVARSHALLDCINARAETAKARNVDHSGAARHWATAPNPKLPGPAGS